MDDVFAPPTERWLRLSPAYVTARRVSWLIGLTIATAAAAGASWLLLRSWPLVVASVVAGLALAAFQWWRLARWVRAWGYAERDEDLYLTRGLYFRELTVVPYGRLQLVRVEAGPIERAFGLATVSLITASVQSGARIPGLDAAEAARLRDRLIEVGQAMGAGQ